MRASVFGSNSRNACVQYAAPPSAPIERGCSIGANHAQSCQLTNSDLTARVAIARFRIIRARFNKHSTQAFPKADHRPKIRNTLLPNSIIDRVCCACLEAVASPNGELSMKTPSLWIFAVGCFGPGARTIWLHKDVKRTATARSKHIRPAIAGFMIGGDLGAACEPAFGLRSLALPTGCALLALVLGPVASLRRGVSQNSLQAVTSSSTIGTDLTGLRRCDLHSQKWTRASQSQLRPT
jgi:hypothetical protein